MNSAQSIQEFRDSVTPILLSEHDIIDWSSVDTSIATAAAAAAELEKVRNEGDFSVDRLAQALGDCPQIYEVALSLIAFNASGSQVSKWGLEASVPNGISGRKHMARQLLHIGLHKVLANTAPIIELLTVAEVYKDSFRRRFRSGDQFGSEVRKIVNHAVRATASELEAPVRIQGDALTDPTIRRSLEYVVTISGRPVVGIATVFQNQSGGRQQRDLSVTYPLLQQKLADYGIVLALIADGQGIAEASDRTLSQLFESVRYPMTLKQAREGALQAALVASAQQPVPETLDAAAISRLITGALDARDAVAVEELPLAEGPAVLALARYVESRRDLGLVLSSNGRSLGWAHPKLIEEARRLASAFDTQRALELLAVRLGSKIERKNTEDGLAWAMLTTPDAPPFAGRILAAAHGAGLTSDGRRVISRCALEHAPGSTFAILLTERDLSGSEVAEHRKRQVVLPINIVIIGPHQLRQIARAANPVGVINKSVLEQSDLAKVSPFILSNATPRRMFFGRDAEAATILGTVSTNSVALLGSRRIGKTSLLRRVNQELHDANFLPFFGDCQTVKTWGDFAALAKSEWGVDAEENFRPQDLGRLVHELGAGSQKPIVILLDEIDQLLEWDRMHKEDSVPEAFFRACRSLSQEGAAQFVFSGERTIAQRIWDPQSPHWNFCRPLPLAQLTQEAATTLLVQPLKGIGIRIEDETRFGEEAWRLTSGHPQIAQYLGDRLVRRLDTRPNRNELKLSADDIVAVAETYQYAEHYLNTYWGQANALEREISLMVASEPAHPGDLLSRLKINNPGVDEGHLEAALRMLQLYGIVVEVDRKIRLRAAWFNRAQSFFGTSNA